MKVFARRLALLYTRNERNMRVFRHGEPVLVGSIFVKNDQYWVVEGVFLGSGGVIDYVAIRPKCNGEMPVRVEAGTDGFTVPRAAAYFTVPLSLLYESFYWLDSAELAIDNRRSIEFIRSEVDSMTGADPKNGFSCEMAQAFGENPNYKGGE